MSMSRSTWKGVERRIAASLRGRRIPVTGIDRDGADVQTPLFCVQSKHGRRRPSYLGDWLDGICGTARDHDRIGIVIWSAKHERHGEAIVLMRMEDFVALHGPVMVDSAPTIVKETDAQ